MFGKDKEKSIVDLAKSFEGQEKGEKPLPTPADATVPEVSEIKDAVASLLENVKNVDSFVEFNLPSLGKMYSGYDKQTVEVRPLKYSDEKKIQQAGQGDRALDALNHVLSTCIKGPKYEDLTIPDKLFCLFKIRQLSYGSEYKCPVVCDSCKKDSILNYDISSMKVDYLEGDMESETTVFLPDSKKTARVRVLRVSDESSMQSVKQLVESLPQYILDVEGQTDSTIISLFVEGTTVRDVANLREAIFTPSYGMDPETEWICDSCAAKNIDTVGVNANFFFTS